MSPAELAVLEGMHAAWAKHPYHHVDKYTVELMLAAPALFRELREAWGRNTDLLAELTTAGGEIASLKPDAELLRRIERERIEVRHHDMIHVGRGEEDSLACAADLRSALAALPEVTT